MDRPGWLREADRAGSDVFGNPEVYCIGGDAATYVSDNGSAFGRIGGYVTDISGAGMGTVYARGGDVEQVFVSQYALPFNYVSSVPLANPAAATAYSPAPASAQLFNMSPATHTTPLGEPSYLDVEQGAVGDCWLLASLAEVAARDPQDIKNMFAYDGTTLDNGSTVGLYSVRFFSTDGVGFTSRWTLHSPPAASTMTMLTTTWAPRPSGSLWPRRLTPWPTASVYVTTST